VCIEACAKLRTETVVFNDSTRNMSVNTWLSLIVHIV
jgi:hypothetical protein